MNKRESQMFKHQLSDYMEYSRQILNFKKRVADISEEKRSLMYKHFVIGSTRIENKEKVNVYMTDKYQELESEEKDISELIDAYQTILRFVDKKLDKMEDLRLRRILIDIYINKKPISFVVIDENFTDDKSVYRAIRNGLLKM